MNRFIPCIFAVNCLCTATALGDDCLLRLETIGYVDELAADDHVDKVLRSIETIVRPGSAFHSKVSFDAQTLTLSGELHPADDGEFRVQIQYIYSVDLGMTVVTEDGGREPVLDKTECLTNLTVTIDTPILVGGTKAEMTRAGEETRTTDIRVVLVLTEFNESPD